MKVSDSSGEHTHPELLEKALTYLECPLTVKQLARKLEVSLEKGCSVVRSLRRRSRVCCLNSGARRGRVYARASLRELVTDADSGEDQEWGLYGWLCFSHRSAVLMALDQPRQPADIKRRARYLDPGIRMSANNVRDVIQLFVRRGIVRAVQDPKCSHHRYALTEKGERLQLLVLAGEARAVST